MGMTASAAEALIAHAWAVGEKHRLTGDHPLVRAIWVLEDAIDHRTTEVGHAAERVEILIGALP